MFDMNLVVNIIIPAIVAGVLAPLIIRQLLRKQRKTGKKFFNDNGRLDLIDECKYKFKSKG